MLFVAGHLAQLFCSVVSRGLCRCALVSLAWNISSLNINGPSITMTKRTELGLFERSLHPWLRRIAEQRRAQRLADGRACLSKVDRRVCWLHHIETSNGGHRRPGRGFMSDVRVRDLGRQGHEGIDDSVQILLRLLASQQPSNGT